MSEKLGKSAKQMHTIKKAKNRTMNISVTTVCVEGGEEEEEEEEEEDEEEEELINFPLFKI